MKSKLANWLVNVVGSLVCSADCIWSALHVGNPVHRALLAAMAFLFVACAVVWVYMLWPRAKKPGDRVSIDVHIDNLTEAQKIALEELFYQWRSLGDLGSSRWTAFYADGDGNFRPRITINGKAPQPSQLAGGPRKRWRDEFRERNVYAIDFDTIGWALREQKDRAKKAVTANG